jgi:hypothetical protein
VTATDFGPIFSQTAWIGEYRSGAAGIVGDPNISDELAFMVPSAWNVIRVGR